MRTLRTAGKPSPARHGFGALAAACSLAALALLGCAAGAAYPASNVPVLTTDKLLEWGYPRHVMTSRHMLVPHLEAVSTDTHDFKFSRSGKLLACVRAVKQWARPHEDEVVTEVIAYDTVRRESRVVFRDVAQNRCVLDWGIYKEGLLLETVLPPPPGVTQTAEENAGDETVIGLIYIPSPVWTSKPRLLCKRKRYEAVFLISPEQATPPVVWWPDENESGGKTTGAVQVLGDGSEPVALPSAIEGIKGLLPLWSPTGKTVIFGTVHRSPPQPRYEFDPLTRNIRQLEPGGRERTPPFEEKTTYPASELAMKTTPLEGTDYAELTLTSAGDDERESHKFRLHTGTAPARDRFLTAFCPGGKGAAFLTQRPDRTLYFVWWDMIDKVNDIYLPNDAMSRVWVVQEALGASIGHDITGNDTVVISPDVETSVTPIPGLEGSYKVNIRLPENPAQALKPYLPKDTKYPDVLDEFTFVRKIPGYSGNYVGYILGPNDFRAILKEDGTLTYRRPDAKDTKLPNPGGHDYEYTWQLDKDECGCDPFGGQ